MVETKNNIRLEVTAGDTVAWNVKLNNITENLRLAYFTVKENPDDDAVIQKTLNAGITLVDNRAYRDQKTYKIQLQSEDTAGLSPDLQYMYDLKVAIGNVVKTIISGVFVVRESVTSPTQIIIDDAEVQAVDLVTAEFETTEATAGIEYEEDPVANAKIGTMTDLNTTQKSTLVGAINEVNTKATNTKEDVDKILDGTLVVPNATNATNATNVTTNINNIALTEIFESDGKRVKKATNATRAVVADSADFAMHSSIQYFAEVDRGHPTAGEFDIPTASYYIISVYLYDENEGPQLNFGLCDFTTPTDNRAYSPVVEAGGNWYRLCCEYYSESILTIRMEYKQSATGQWTNHNNNDVWYVCKRLAFDEI